MTKGVRQGLGIALLGGAAWGAMAVLSLIVDSSGWNPIAGLTVGMVALVGVAAAIIGVVVAGVSLVRDRS